MQITAERMLSSSFKTPKPAHLRLRVHCTDESIYSISVVAVDNSLFKNTPGRGSGVGGCTILTEAGMLVVPLRGENPGFWYRLGFSKQNTCICIKHRTF